MMSAASMASMRARVAASSRIGLNESTQHFRLAIHFNVYPGGGIAHPSVKHFARSQVVNKWPKSNPLDNAGDVDADANQNVVHQK